jgi:zinc finger FYVE domain-containing protein 1
MLGNAGAIDDQQENNYDQGLNENHRTRQLLKVLAISDIVIYKTRAERLHTDLFYFMGDASKAYNEHFSAELQKVLMFCYSWNCYMCYI